jgi:hypothetical protein
MVSTHGTQDLAVSSATLRAPQEHKRMYGVLFASLVFLQRTKNCVYENFTTLRMDQQGRATALFLGLYFFAISISFTEAQVLSPLAREYLSVLAATN